MQITPVGGATGGPPPPPTNTSSTPANLYQAIPNLTNLLSTASGNINNLLTGLPSAPLAQTTAAYAGAGMGQPGQANALGSFVGNMGANLYNQQSQANQQTGLGDLMNLIGTSSGTLAPSAAQNQQNSQFYSQLGQQGNEFQQSLAEQQFMDQINALVELSNSGIGGTGLPSSNTSMNSPNGTNLSSILNNGSTNLSSITGNPTLLAALQAAAMQGSNSSTGVPLTNWLTSSGYSPSIASELAGYL